MIPPHHTKYINIILSILSATNVLHQTIFSLQRMTIIGVILSFRELLYEALNAQLEERIPFLYTTVSDVHEHSQQSEQSAVLINEMASAAGFASQIDPLLLQTVQVRETLKIYGLISVSCTVFWVRDLLSSAYPQSFNHTHALHIGLLPPVRELLHAR